MKNFRFTAFLRLTLMAAVAAALTVKSTSAHATTVTVNVGSNGLMFSPSSVSINAGDTVQWVWKSNGHSVTSGTPGAPTNQFNSGIKSDPFTFFADVQQRWNGAILLRAAR